MNRMVAVLACGVLAAAACTVEDDGDDDDEGTGGRASSGTGGTVTTTGGRATGNEGGEAASTSTGGDDNGSGGSLAGTGGSNDDVGGADTAGGPGETAGADAGGATGDGGVANQSGSPGTGGKATGTGGTPPSGPTGTQHGTVDWTEDFENGATEWSVMGGVWAVGEPTASDGPAAFEGTNVAGTVLGGDYGASHDAWLISPEIPVPDADENPRFAFRYWYELAAGDTGYVYLRVDGGGWSEIMRVNQSGDGSWRNLAFPLHEYADRTVEFGFRLVTNTTAFAPGFYVDDARFITGDVGMGEYEDFENGWGDWSAYGGVFDVGEPTASDGPEAVDGTHLAGTTLSGDYADSHDAWMLSPVLDIPSEEDEPRFAFDYWYELSTGDTAYLYVRADGGGWNEIMRVNQTGDGSWRSLSFPLNEYADRQVELGFRLVTNTAAYAPGFYFDNVRFETGPAPVAAAESFENGFNGWSAYGGVWAVGEPTADDGPTARTGDAVAGTILSGDYGDSHDAWLVSPRVFVPSQSANPTLSYWYWYDFAAGDTGYAYIRVDGGGWQNIDTLNQSGDGDWRQREFELEDYKDRHVELAFRLVTNTAAYAPGWYIDDVSFNLE